MINKKINIDIGLEIPESIRTVFANIADDTKPSQYFFVMVMLSCTVATYGLLLNSTAVVIGAMLIAPLMGPILGGAASVATGNNHLFKIALKSALSGSVLAVMLSALLTVILPNTELTSEVMSRTSPTILDLVIALASGAAGTYAMCVNSKSVALPGVAIATALMPPLCVAGIGLAKQNYIVVYGSIILFLANMIAISVAAIVVFEILGFSKLTFEAEQDLSPSRKYRRKIIYPLVLLILISIPLAYIMYNTYIAAKTERIIRTNLSEYLDAEAPNSQLVSITYDETPERYKINSTLRSTKIVKPENIKQIENLLELRLGKKVTLTADVVLTQRVDDKSNIDSFSQLLPKAKEKEIVEIIKSSTPEEIIGTALSDKIKLMSGVELVGYSFGYDSRFGTYNIVAHIKIKDKALDEKFTQAVKSVLEEDLKRRVELKLEVSVSSNM